MHWSSNRVNQGHTWRVHDAAGCEKTNKQFCFTFKKSSGKFLKSLGAAWKMCSYWGDFEVLFRHQCSSKPTTRLNSQLLQTPIIPVGFLPQGWPEAGCGSWQQPPSDTLWKTDEGTAQLKTKDFHMLLSPKRFTLAGCHSYMPKVT